MTHPNRLFRPGTLRHLAVFLSFTIPSLCWSQVAASTPPTVTQSVARTGDSGAAEGDEQVVKLSPFEVKAEANGYQALNTMSGTRLNSKLEDIAASITVVTKQQLIDTAAVDINDIFSNESNTEGIYQFTSFTNDRGNLIDNIAQAPETANRVRGLGNANIATNGFATSSAIPVDTYNLDSVEISRGPNSNLFGVGEPSGTINLIRGRANLLRDVSQTSVRVDDRGSFRSTFDLNRVLWKDKLAVRVAAVHDHLTYERKPSKDVTNRLTASVSFRPWNNTLIRGTYESYSNYSSRANSTTPRDFITEWQQNGSPVWDPTFSGIGGWRLLNGTTYTSVTPSQEATLLPRGINPNGSGFWNRPSLFVDSDGSVGRYEVNRAGNAVATGVIPSPGAANSNLRYQQIGTLISRGGGAFGSVALPLYNAPAVTDQSIYDWESVNLSAPNFGHKQADIVQVELEQGLLNGTMNKLALQAGWLRERISNDSRAYVAGPDGAKAEIQLDINEKLLDGTANPYFLRPYIGGSEMQTYRRPELNDHYKLNLAYEFDATQQSNWTKWLGRHNFVGYAEYRQRMFAPSGLRYRDQIISSEPWHNAANLTNIPDRGAENRFYTRYYFGDKITEPGRVIDYAPSAPDPIWGTRTFRYYNGAQAIDEPVEVGEAYFALGKQKSQLRTRGIIWQSFLFDSRVVPSFGYRRDNYRVTTNTSVPLGADGFRDLQYLDIYSPTWIENSGPTKTKGVVIRPFSGWSPIERRASEGSFVFDALRTFRLHYNESDSFQPQTLAYNLFGEALPNTRAAGKDYGLSFSLLQDKLYVKFSKYKTNIANDRNGATAVVGTRPIRLDFDASGDAAVFGTSGGDGFDLEDTVYGWLTQIRPGLSLAEYEKQTYAIMGVTQAEVDALKNKTLADVNDTTSEGTEVEIYYNPSKFWTVKANFTEQIAIDTSVSPNIQRYIDKRFPSWTSIRVPTDQLPGGGQLPNAGRLWWEVGSSTALLAPTADAGSNAPRNFYSGSVDAPYKLAVTQNGKPRPQTRKYRFNLTTNYRLAGLGTDNSILKNMSVGGTARWLDKGGIGFLAAAPDADGVVRVLDGNKPVYDKARYEFDGMVSYNFKMWRNRINTRLQLNVRNVFENGRLQAVAVNPDGTPYAYRIIDPRQILLTATFDF